MPISKISWTRKGCLVKVIGLVAIVITLIVIGLYSLRSKAVLYRFVETGTPSGKPLFSIFNPLRDHSSERSAEAFLERVKSTPCDQVLAELPLETKYRQYICEQESNNPLLAWRLTDREDSFEKVKIYYQVKRKNYTNYDGKVWVTVEKLDGQWRTTHYESIY